MNLNRICLLAAFVCWGNAFAQVSDEIVEGAAARYDNSFLQNWAFTETRTTSDSIRIAQYDPTRGAGDEWILISLNGEQPEQDEIDDFLDEKAARKAEREKDDGNGNLLEMITPGSLELIEETTEGWRYSFQPQDDEDEKFMQHVDGELWVPKQGQFLESMSMKSRGSFKPQTGVKIREFSMQMQFGPAIDSGPIVPLSMTSHVAGKAFLVATIDEKVVVEFSDYKPVN